MTMAFVRLMTALLKDPDIGERVVPIVADEARTFGMANLFKQVGIYSSVGQRYEPEDIGSILSYREARDGQILEEGISEAGAISSWTAAATSYSAHGVAMLPFYIYYSMFGFQRIGDLIWAAADQRARGFLMGATSGRTTLGGEGLQHQDGHSHLLAATVPNCRAYDPAYAGELAVIIDYGMKRMLSEQCDEFFYITVMNENYPQLSLPEGVEQQVIEGLYRVERKSPKKPLATLNLMGSGSLLPEVREAAELLSRDWNIGVDVWSVTSFSELERNARECERWNRLHPLEPARESVLDRAFDTDAPVVAVSDYVRALPQLIAPYLDAPYSVLGTDGFGRSDTREQLRDFFEISRQHIVIAALSALVKQHKIPPELQHEAIHRYQLRPDQSPSWLI